MFVSDPEQEDPYDEFDDFDDADSAEDPGGMAVLYVCAGGGCQNK